MLNQKELKSRYFYAQFTSKLFKLLLNMDTQKYKIALLNRRKELIDHADKSKQSRAPVELDPNIQGRISRQDALMQQAMAEATQNKRNQEIQRINAALSRIDSGDFGYCVTCDEDIAKARLDNDPAVPTCINCAQ